MMEYTGVQKRQSARKMEIHFCLFMIKERCLAIKGLTKVGLMVGTTDIISHAKTLATECRYYLYKLC